MSENYPYICVFCGRPMQSAFPKHDHECIQPVNGASVEIHCGYGSQYDMDNFRGAICDNCIEQAVDRGLQRGYWQKESTWHRKDVCQDNIHCQCDECAIPF